MSGWRPIAHGRAPGGPGKAVNVQEQLPVFVLEEDAVRERLIDTGSGLFLLPGFLAEDDA